MKVMNWDPIEIIGAPEFVEVHPHYPALNVFDIKLSRSPDREWIHHFETYPSSMHPFRVGGDRIRITPSEGELSAYFEEVKRRVRMTNTMYQENVLPWLREREAAAARQEGEQHERIERARREAEKLHLNDG
jgi:hypothetical protein